MVYAARSQGQAKTALDDKDRARNKRAAAAINQAAADSGQSMAALPAWLKHGYFLSTFSFF
jgi:hypothetical protein